MAIARGSPCVVPSVDAISPLPVMKSLIGAVAGSIFFRPFTGL